MVVTEPLKVVIDDLPDDHEELLEVPFGKDASFGTHTVPFTKTVYIERSDFREVDSPDYFRLAPGKTVGLLKVPYPITATSFEKDPATGAVTVVHAKYEKPAEGETAPRPKTFIHWVGESAKRNSPIRAEIRAFNSLFKSEDPSAHPDGFLADINPDSEEIYKDAMIETGFNEIRRTAPWPKAAGETDVESNQHCVRFQGMRIAYFAVDRESTADKVILNRIVTLKDTQGKN
jgi:glutaminyl-tRNA synthetase